MEDLVLVVDDEAKIRELVSSYLKKNGYRVLAAGTGKEALALLEREPVSLLLLDLMLPDLSGEELCAKIRAVSELPVIMMTARADEESVINGLSIGADDYVTKPFSPRELMARTAAILRRSRMISRNEPRGGRILAWEGLSANLDERRVSVNGGALALTPNEYNILMLLMSRPQKIFTRDEIIAAVKDDYDGFDRTIDTHVKNLRQKLGDPKYIHTVYGVGYRFGGAA
ncbi:MAG: response regulator transcription factor [Spirochaetaceae bacterium]|jgi:DNA-binding response OmpR family regulator|nr:response regulator transcription factor [Spirochaetaceae bacterium]